MSTYHCEPTVFTAVPDQNEKDQQRQKQGAAAIPLFSESWGKAQGRNLVRYSLNVDTT